MLESVPLVFERVYGFNIGEAGLVFLGQVLGSSFGLGEPVEFLSLCPKLTTSSAPVINHFTEKMYQRNVDRIGPEARLYSAMIGGVLLPAGCWIYAWTTFPQVHWIVPCIGITILYVSP